MMPKFSQFARLTNGIRRPLILRAFNSASSPKSSRKLPNLFIKGFAFGIVGGLAFGGLSFLAKSSQKPVAADAGSDFAQAGINLQPPTDLPPFPAHISINKEQFLAVGTGVRMVTFLNFHVYGCGLYINTNDIENARKILRKAAEKHQITDTQRMADLLNDPQYGPEIINELLKSNARFALRIVPTRNTDYPHLRDGFVRSVTNHPEAKALQSAEFGQSINEMKKAFSRKRKLQKGDVITWVNDITGGMTAWYGPDDEHKELLGSLPNADVARLFFLQYLAVSKPNSPSLKAQSLNGLALMTA